MSSLKTRINDDMKAAMKAKDSTRLGAIRLLLAAMKQKEVDERVVLEDADVLAIIERMLKQRKDSIGQYQAAGRQDLADAERFEAEVLSAYMPAALTTAEIEAIVAAAVVESGATGVQEMGKVVALVKPQVLGRADMSEVSKLVKAKLSA
ncbi:GatB/YqeY domain-containing protein [Denitratisoma sp. agr-D3]